MHILPPILEITSAQNSQFKAWRKLRNRRDRKKQGRYLVEGFHLVEEALRSEQPVSTIIVAKEVDSAEFRALLPLLPAPIGEGAGMLEYVELPGNLFKELTETPTPQGILAVIELEQEKGERRDTLAKLSDARRLLLLDNVQDPGNVGTMIRTADAAGFDAVILGHGTADLYNDKTIRATQGSLFHLPILEADLTKLLPELHKAGFDSWVTTLGGATEFHALRSPEKCALIMGNEGQGVSEVLLKMATTRVKIPMPGRAESLNVGVAAGILIYQLIL